MVYKIVLKFKIQTLGKKSMNPVNIFFFCSYKKPFVENFVLSLSLMSEENILSI